MKVKRHLLAALFSGLFLVLLFFTSITATTTLKETTAQVSIGLPQIIFSLSSASILLLPLAICAMLGALAAFGRKQLNVGFLFSFVAFLSFGAFLLLFAQEKANPTLYAPLSDALKEDQKYVYLYKEKEQKEKHYELSQKIYLNLQIR